MRQFALLCSAAVLFGCAKTENPPAADTGMAAAPTPAPAAVALSDVAGTWAVTGKYEGKDNVVVSYDLTATADSTGWTIKFPGRANPEPIRIVSVSGDSIVTEGGPYESAISKGVQVTTRGVLRLQDGKLMGTTIAHYAMKGPDSLRVIVSEGTRK
ncbi:MAG: hypothetical protein ABI681_00935 [Gemmatimonadales bacterium]